MINRKFERAFIFTEDATHVGNKDVRKVAFTLAEVLITLAIIGVIAAVTIPLLVKNFQHKVLEVQFKRSVSIMQNAILMAKQELGVEPFSKYCGAYINSQYVHAKECELAFMNQMVKLSSPKCTYGNTQCMPYSIQRSVNDIFTYNGKNNFVFNSMTNSVYYTNTMPNATFIGVTTCGNYFIVVVDLNGYTKPNRVGQDIFVFKLNNNDNLISYGTPNNNITDEQAETKFEFLDDSNYKRFEIGAYGNPCNLESSRSGNGIGCAHYALQNKCPWDNTKTYWECLP